MAALVRTSLALTALRRHLVIDRNAGRFFITLGRAGEPADVVLVYVACRSLRLTCATRRIGLVTHQLWADNGTGAADTSVAFDLTTEEAHRISDWTGITLPAPLALLEQARA